MVDEEQVVLDAQTMTIKGMAYRHGTTERKVRGILKAHGVVLDQTSSLERYFDTAWEQARRSDDERVTPYLMPAYQKQVNVVSWRRWRFDVAWPEYSVAVELHGGSWIGGRHTRPVGLRSDCEKLNAAVLADWRVLVFTTDMLEEDPIGCISQVLKLLDLAEKRNQREVKPLPSVGRVLPGK